MNRAGFLLLAIGVILGTLGFYYDEPRFTGIGLVPLIVLFVLSAAFTEVVDFTHNQHSEPQHAIVDFAWRGAVVVGVALTLLALWHSTVSGGTGIPLAIAAAALPASIFLYTSLNDTRVREWRAKRGVRRRGRRADSG